MKFFNLSHFCSSGNHIAGTLGPSLFSECSTCLGTSRATESERLLMSAQKHKAGQWIWCRSTKEMCAGVTQWGSWDVPLAASTRRPRGQQKRGKTPFTATRICICTCTAHAAAAALSQTKAARDAKAFRGKHVGKVLQVLQISLAALACGWPQKPMELELELELEVAKCKSLA